MQTDVMDIDVLPDDLECNCTYLANEEGLGAHGKPVTLMGGMGGGNFLINGRRTLGDSCK